jgi:hypothetical protein
VARRQFRLATAWPALVVAAFVLAVIGWVVADLLNTGPSVHVYSAAIPGYSIDPSSTGKLSVAAAAQTTIMPTETLGPELHRDGFVNGQARTWRKGDDFVEIVAYRMSSAKHARALMQFGLSYAMQLPGGGVQAGKAALFTVPGLPSAHGFIADGNSASVNQPLFVQGAWYVDGPIAYLVETGGPQPASVAFAIDLTKRQHALTK